MREHLTAQDLRELDTVENDYSLGQTWLQLAQAFRDADGLLAQMFRDDVAPEAA